jgi:glucose-6-phosphate 1-dehydrogenase
MKHWAWATALRSMMQLVHYVTCSKVIYCKHLAMVAMEQPKDLKPESIRAEKIKLLESIRPIDVKNIHKQAFRAQYAAGRVCVGDGHGENVLVILEELKRDGVESSNTETYAAVKLFIDNPRWKGVPFYVRTAKRMHEGNTAIAIRFKKAPMLLTMTNITTG